MTTIAQGQIGPEATYSFKFENGKLIATAKYAGADLGVEFSTHYNAIAVVDALIDAIEKAIPGDQTHIANILKAAVKGAAV